MSTESGESVGEGGLPDAFTQLVGALPPGSPAHDLVRGYREARGADRGALAALHEVVQIWQEAETRLRADTGGSSSETGPGNEPPRLVQAAAGFRAFGSEVRRFEFSNDIVVIHAPNSQGKTSLFEAVEFLFTGSTSRRALLGSAAAEFEASLRNVHIDASHEVSVTAAVTTADGTEVVVRRVLEEDCTGQRDCRSAPSVDGVQCDELPATLGIVLSAPPIAAPVLFQHTLRYVVSAKPQERVEYFKRVFELEELDRLRADIAKVRGEAAQPQTPHLDALVRTPRGVAVRRQLQQADTQLTGLRAILVGTLGQLHGAQEGVASDTSAHGLQHAITRAREVLAHRRNARSPMPLLLLPEEVATAAGRGVGELDLSPLHAYAEVLDRVDQAHARLVPVYERALDLPELRAVTHDSPIDCPLCLSSHALTFGRVEQIRAELLALSTISESAAATRTTLSRERDQVRLLWRHAGVVPAGHRPMVGR